MLSSTASDNSIGLIGAGAVGTLFAAAFCHTHKPFIWVVRNPQRRQELDALRMVVGEQQLKLALKTATIVDSIQDLPSTNWLVLAVKAHQVQPLVDQLQQPAVNLLVVANGLHDLAVHLGLLYGGALVADGRLITTTSNELLIGALPGASGDPGVLPDVLAAPWLQASISDVIRARMWHKLALNCAVNPLTALLDCPNGVLLDSVTSPLIQGVLTEVDAVARRELGKQWPNSTRGLTADLHALIETTADNSSSMREDLRAGRETEIARLNLAVAAAGLRHGLPCPLNDKLGNMVSLLANRGTP